MPSCVALVDESFILPSMSAYHAPMSARLTLLGLVVLTALAPTAVVAQDATDAGVSEPAVDLPSEETQAAPTTIFIGVYPVRVGDLDLRTGTASVAFYRWTRWTGSSDGTALELSNGTIDSCDHEYRYEENGVRYAYYLCRARVQLQLDFHAFPFDEHDVGIEYEHAEEGSSTVLFAIDDAALAHVRTPTIPGWLVDAPRYDVVMNEYQTSWGMPSVSPDEISTYPRARMRMRIHHDVGTTFFKTFLTLFISVLIAFLAFFMHPDVLDARVGVGVAGIFGAVTSHSVVQSNLPEIPYMTLSDRIHLTGMLFIFLALLESCAIGYLIRRDKTALATRVDLLARFGMAPAFAVLVLLFVVLR